jgi:hypothetical protein
MNWQVSASSSLRALACAGYRLIFFNWLGADPRSENPSTTAFKASVRLTFFFKRRIGRVYFAPY